MFERLFGSRAGDPAVAARVPPGQYLTEKFPVLHFGRTPGYPDLSAWDLRVWGEVETPFSLRWAELRALPARDVPLDIHCVTRWSKLDTTWQGVPIRHLAEVVRLKPSARFVVFHAEYGFTSNVPLEVALEPDAICAWSYAGEPL